MDVLIWQYCSDLKVYVVVAHGDTSKLICCQPTNQVRHLLPPFFSVAMYTSQFLYIQLKGKGQDKCGKRTLI